MQQPGLDQRHRDKDGTIGRTHGITQIGTLRGTYGQHFADGIADTDKRGDVLRSMAGAYEGTAPSKGALIRHGRTRHQDTHRRARWQQGGGSALRPRDIAR
jgi:hypothetical protein